MRKIKVFDNFDCVYAMGPGAYENFAEDCAKGLYKPDQKPDYPQYANVNGVAVIDMEGVIMRMDLGYFCGLKDTEELLQAALNDTSIRAILLNINSPGGIATGVKELADFIFESKAKKPIAAWVDGMCCSAAYWLAAATGRIYAGPSATVGSIGVLMRHMSKKGLNEKIGLSYTYITAGGHKAVGNPDSDLSAKDVEILQNRVDELYNMFTGDVARYMGLALENKLSWADGRDFLASNCPGLVTQILKSKTAAIEKLLQEAFMDKAELAKNQPELLTAIQNEAKEEALKELEAAKMDAAQHAAEGVLNMVARLGGKEYADKARALLNAKISPAQIDALFNAGLSFAQSEPKSAMLRNIEQNTSNPLPEARIQYSKADLINQMANL